MKMGMNSRYQLALAVLVTTVLGLGSVGHPRVVHAAVYYVATTGNDASPGTEARPFQTLGKGMSMLQPGDTLSIRGGTYEVINPSSMTIPSGTSWEQAVTIRGYPGETVTLGGIWLHSGTSIAYVIFDHLVLNPGGLFIGTGSHHIRLSNSDINASNAFDNAVFFGDSADSNELINCSVHNAVYHGLYITSSNNLFDGTRVYNNGWWGYHLFHGGNHATVNNNIIRNSEIFNNGLAHAGAYGIIVSAGRNNEVYNNIVRDNPNGIQVAYDSVNAYIHDNTIYGNRMGSIDIYGTIGTRVENNIVYGNGRGIFDWGSNIWA